MNYNYTLIIPHFNIPQLLNRLLRTVPKRDDLQVIVVDDCSTKGTEELELLKKEYDWVEWYDTGTNGGGGKARNIGIQHANGKYLLFADADDFFTPAIYDVLDSYINATSDIIFCNVSSVNSISYKPSNRVLFHNYAIELYNSNQQKASNKLRFSFGEPWSKLIRTELVRKHAIKFQETPCYNDTQFSYLCGFFCKSVTVDNRVTYIVTFRNDSVVNSVIKEREELFYSIFIKKESFFIKNHIPEHAYNVYDLIISDMFNLRWSRLKKSMSLMKKEIPVSVLTLTLLRRMNQRICNRIGWNRSALY